MNKGNDRITATITHALAGNKASSFDNVVDEIKQFYDFRYISPCEAAWRIFGFATHYSSVPIHRLNYHLEGEHSITYADDEDVNVITAKEGNQTSHLLQYFKTNKRDEEARKLLYIKFPSHYVWKTAISDWNTRQKQKSYGRMHNASPTSCERFYLKMLLNNIRGATCFEDLRTVNGKLYTTFKETCHALGYLDEDKQYIVALNEASVSGSGHSLQRIFVTLLSSESLSTPLEIWTQTWHLLSEDILYRQREIRQSPDYIMTDEQIKNQNMLEIEKLLQHTGSSLRNYSTMPFLENINFPPNNRLIVEESSYNRQKCAKDYHDSLPRLTDEQREVFKRIISPLESDGGVFFLYGFGGTGKTFIWSTLSNFIRSKGEIVVNIASSAMAALLLQGGRTAHSRFSIPIQVNESSFCTITPESDIVGLLREAKLIIWDEAPMLHIVLKLWIVL